MSVHAPIAHASSIIAQSTFGTIAFNARSGFTRSLLLFRIAKQGTVRLLQLTALSSSMYIPPVRYVSVSILVDAGNHSSG
jgi:hypothetical protein